MQSILRAHVFILIKYQVNKGSLIIYDIKSTDSLNRISRRTVSSAYV